MLLCSSENSGALAIVLDGVLDAPLAVGAGPVAEGAPGHVAVGDGNSTTVCDELWEQPDTARAPSAVPPAMTTTRR
ncbi:MAG: hypothetical protein WCP28_22360 [Actinomycetes bacterium]